MPCASLAQNLGLGHPLSKALCFKVEGAERGGGGKSAGGGGREFRKQESSGLGHNVYLNNICESSIFNSITRHSKTHGARLTAGEGKCAPRPRRLLFFELFLGPLWRAFTFVNALSSPLFLMVSIKTPALALVES